MRHWALAMVVAGMVAAGCGRETTHTVPPSGGWENGAWNSKSFSGATTPQFNFKDAVSPTRDALVGELAGGEDLGGPITFDF